MKITRRQIRQMIHEGLFDLFAEPSIPEFTYDMEDAWKSSQGDPAAAKYAMDPGPLKETVRNFLQEANRKSKLYCVEMSEHCASPEQNAKSMMNMLQRFVSSPDDFA